MSGWSDKGAWVILKDGPLAGMKVDTWIGRVGLIPEYQLCDQEWCHSHPITHEYRGDGTWLRSYSYLTSWQGADDVGAD